MVGDEIGEDAAEGRAGIEHREEVEAQGCVNDAGVDGVGLDVEQEVVEAQEAQEHGDAEHDVGRFFEGGEEEELALLFGGEAQAHEGLGEGDGSEAEEA